MTEREYVEAIRNAAIRYRAIFNLVESDTKLTNDDWQAIYHWEEIKVKLSASTAIALCDAWVAQEAPKTREASSVAQNHLSAA